MANVNEAQQLLGMTTPSDSGIPLEHMDYDYIGQCTNVKELEKIFRVLKSGKEGHYPHLVDFCEKRIVDLAPQSKALRKDIRPATENDLGEEFRKIKDEVSNWESNMTSETANQNAPAEEDGSENLPPVRNRGTINTAGKKNDDSNQEWGKPSAERIKGSDFRKWDQFDAEAEAAKVDDRDEKDQDLKAASQKLAKSRSAGNKDIIDTSGMTDRERELSANREKDKGNEAFRASDYKEAIHYYSRSLSVVASAPAYNNRSLARIKLGEYEGAVEDCTKVLELEPSNIKALLRRGTARKSLKSYKLAHKDLQAVLQVEPNNKQAIDLVKDVVGKMEKGKAKEDQKREAKDSAKDAKLPNGDGKKSGGRRLVIEEIENDDSEDEEEEDDDSRGESERDLRDSVQDDGVKASEIKAMTAGSGQKDGTKDVCEPDGCIGSKPRSENSPSSPPQEKAAEVQPQEAPKPIPPPPAPPLPDAVVFLKDAGNDFFKKGQYADALERYTKAISKVNKDVHPLDLAVLYSNRASCNLRSGNPKACIQDCNAALDLSPSNIKIYNKRAQAYEAVESYAHAYVDYKSAVNYDFYNKSAQNGASRMASYLQGSYGQEWRSKLPSQPKGPGFSSQGFSTAQAQSPQAPQEEPSTSPPQESPQKQSRATGTSPTPIQTTPAAVQVTPTPVQATPTTAQAPPTAPSSKAGATPFNGVHPSGGGTPSAAASVPAPAPAPGKAAKTREEKPRELSKEERFQEFKAQGNDLVKKGQYSPAIACYTRCMEVDPHQAVSYCNRALCYLKLNLHGDAIKDCDEALQRDPKNVKALYRRAQARKLLSNYQESARDLTELLKIEPTNAPAKKELDLVKDAWRKELREKQSKQSQEASQQRPSGESDEGKKKKKPGKRIQIQEVDDGEEDSRADTSKSNTTTSHPGNLKHAHTKTTSSPAADKPTTTSSKTRDSKGGKENNPSGGSNTANGIPHEKKMTAYEFMQEWTSLKRRKNEEGYASLLKQVQPNDIPKVLSNKLDGDMLSKILSASANHLVDQDADFTYQLLTKLRGVDRFRTMTMFLTKMDKANLQRCINRLSSHPEVCKEDELKKLKKAFNL